MIMTMTMTSIMKRGPSSLVPASSPRRLAVFFLSSQAMAISAARIVRIPARKARVVDTTGAGDTMNGAFAYALSVDMAFEEALHFANAAAALSIEKAGAQTGMPSLEAVQAKLAE